MQVRWRTVPVRMVVFFAGVFLTYLVVVNGLLVTGAARAILNRLSPVHAHFDWTSAYSPWFMRVHVRGMVFRGEDSSVQWEMKFDRASATIACRDLFSKRVHLSGAKASGVGIRMRFKVDASEITPELLAALPPMPPELANPPVKPAIPPPAPTDDDYFLWTVQVDDVVGEHVREVWVDSLRYTEVDGFVQGGFFFRPLRTVRVPGADYRATNGAVSIGGHALVDNLHGTLAITIHDLDMHAPTWLDALRAIDASTNSAADIEDLRGISRELHGGAGTISATFAVAGGALLPHSQARLRSDAWTFARGEASVSGSSLVSGHVDQDSVVHAQMDTSNGTFEHARAVVAKGGAFAIVFRSADASVTRPPEHWNASVNLTSASLPNLAALDSLFGNEVFKGGTARVSAHADVDDHSAANARFDLKDVDVSGIEGWWATFSASPLAYSIGGTPSFNATFIGKIRDAQAPLAVLGAPAMARAFVGDGTFAVKSIVHVAGSTVRLDDVRLMGDAVDVLAHLRKDAHGASGAMLVETKLANVGLDVAHGGAVVHPLASHAWYEGTVHAE
jgi:hypothetical protein